MWKKAINEYRDGVTIEIEVSPNAKREGIRTYNEWRNRILITMKEKPEKFKVNKEIVLFFSSLFNVPANNVKILSGEKSRQKTVFIRGVSRDEAERIIGRFLE